MSRTGEWAMELRIKAEMSEETYQKIPPEVKNEIKIKRIEAVNYKEIYRQDKKWKEYNKMLSEVIKERANREDEIRSELKK